MGRQWDRKQKERLRKQEQALTNCFYLGEAKNLAVRGHIWELSSNKRRAILWENRRDFIYNASRAELKPLCEATSVADGLFQQEEESKYLKIE